MILSEEELMLVKVSSAAYIDLVLCYYSLYGQGNFN